MDQPGTEAPAAETSSAACQAAPQERRPQAKARSRPAPSCPQLNLVEQLRLERPGPGGQRGHQRRLPFSTGQPNFHEFFYGLAGLAGESQGFDGNGTYLRVNAGGGPKLVSAPNPAGGSGNSIAYGNTISAPLGTQPAYPRPASRRSAPTCPATRIPFPTSTGPTAAVAQPDLRAVAMKRAIREHARDFTAIIVLLVLAGDPDRRPDPLRAGG